jgi:hypothetical protein
MILVIIIVGKALKVCLILYSETIWHIEIKHCDIFYVAKYILCRLLCHKSRRVLLVNSNP